MKENNYLLKSAIYGLAVGDALGVPYEFKKRGTFNCVDMVGYGSWNQPKGTWSDDTSLTIATCDSIRRCNGINLEDILDSFRKWRNGSMYTPLGSVFDVGATTNQAILTGKGSVDEHSNGNGSLMRIIPLAFVQCSQYDVELVSAITHGHRCSTTACRIYVEIAKELIKARDIKDVLKELKCEAPYHRISNIADLKEGQIRSTGYVVDSLEAALWCVVNTDNYKDCVLKAVNLGDDTDTTAAIAGALAGIIYTYKAIPQSWIDSLVNKQEIDRCLF